MNEPDSINEADRKMVDELKRRLHPHGLVVEVFPEGADSYVNVMEIGPDSEGRVMAFSLQELRDADDPAECVLARFRTSDELDAPGH